jgi:hypothetical protein
LLNHKAEIGGSPQTRTEFQLVKSQSFTIKVCNPKLVDSAD